MVNFLALIIALVVSSVSAYFSIIGLTTLFSAAFWPVVIMGGSLEVGKLVTTSWLYRYWDTCPWLLKSYLSVAVVVLMFITSMGTFGFLSKAHIEQTLNISTGEADKLAIVQSQVENKKSVIEDYDKQLKQIDDALSKITEKGRGESSLLAADKQRKTRNEIVAKKNAETESLSKLKAEVVRIGSEVKKAEAEVGPLRYIAEAVYGGGQTTSEQLDRAVRMVILMLVAVFDPLAVVLLIAANHGMSQTKQFTKLTENDILNIDSNVLGDVHVIKRQDTKELYDQAHGHTGRLEDLYQEGHDPDHRADDQRGAVRIS